MKLKRVLIGMAALVVLTTGCTPEEINGWLKWHSADPEAAQAYLQQPDVAAQVAEHIAATAAAPAERIDPPAGWSTESANGRCVGFEGLLTQYSPGWNVARMSAIMYRESRCQPDASNSCCSGLLQMHRMHVPDPPCGVFSRADYYDPAKNICAAAILWQASGYGAWSTS